MLPPVRLVSVAKYSPTSGNREDRKSMSRIGRKPVTIPAGVTITLDGTKVTVKGPKGTLERNIDKHLSVKIEGTELLVTRPDDSISMKMIHGTTRALIQNMVDGVSNGFSKDLEIRGVGYKCEMQGKNLVLHVGHSHADTIVPPEGVVISTGKNMSIKVEGIDKELVGQVAANIRNIKKPEPYHGKGIRYKDEVVVIRQPSAKKKGAAGAAAK